MLLTGRFVAFFGPVGFAVGCVFVLFWFVSRFRVAVVILGCGRFSSRCIRASAGRCIIRVEAIRVSLAFVAFVFGRGFYFVGALFRVVALSPFLGRGPFISFFVFLFMCFR